MTAPTYHIPGRGDYCLTHHYRLDTFGGCALCRLVAARRADTIDQGSHPGDTDHSALADAAWDRRQDGT